MEKLLQQLVRQVQGKYYGKYRGFVVDNDDPEQLARVTLRVPSVLGDSVSGWALPCLPFGGLGDQGLFSVPEVSAQVWVEFEEGDLSNPIWTGTFWQQSGDIPGEAAKSPPTTRELKTPSGHILQFDDEDGEEQIRLFHKQDAELKMDKDGSVTLNDKQGAKLTLDANANEVVLEDANGNKLTMSSSGTVVEDSNGNKIEMTAANIKVQGSMVVVQGNQVMLGGQGGEPIIKGTSFLTLFATHIHPTGVGPSGPPIPQGEMTSLSTKVMTT